MIFWDIYGKLGHPVRATVSEMGPTLLGRVLDLNATQDGVLEVVFKVADDEGLLLLDLADLRALLSFAAANAKDISGRYGLISRPASPRSSGHYSNWKAMAPINFLASPRLNWPT